MPNSGWAVGLRFQRDVAPSLWSRTRGWTQPSARRRGRSSWDSWHTESIFRPATARYTAPIYLGTHAISATDQTL